MYGKIISWFPTRRFGSIRGEESDQEFFFHVTDIVGGKPLPKWSHVVFDLGRFGGKTKAINVRPTGPTTDGESVR